jgi:hypothetical protein
MYKKILTQKISQTRNYLQKSQIYEFYNLLVF